MAASNSLEYCIINISASPHPEGIYISIIEKMSEFECNYWGDRNARISSPVAVEPGYYRGRIATWNEIDFRQPGISKDRLEEIDLSEIGRNFPPEIGVNARIFSYVLREKDHRIIVETRNELGYTLSPLQAGKIFRKLSDKYTELNPKISIEITVVPEEQAIDKILSIPQLKTLTIRIVRPNPDDIADEAADVLKELDDEGAKSKEITLKAASGESLKPNERTRAQMRVGSVNGYVEGKGRNADGEDASYSTRAHPRVFRKFLDDMGSALASILSIAKGNIRSMGDQQDT